jgi:Berberine and berberine like
MSVHAVRSRVAADDDAAARTAAAYGSNYQRLQRVKAEYDPTTSSA